MNKTLKTITLILLNMFISALVIFLLKIAFFDLLLFVESAPDELSQDIKSMEQFITASFSIYPLILILFVRLAYFILNILSKGKFYISEAMHFFVNSSTTPIFFLVYITLNSIIVIGDLRFFTTPIMLILFTLVLFVVNIAIMSLNFRLSSKQTGKKLWFEGN